MTALATIDDLTDRLGRDVTTLEALRLDRLLTDASAAVRSYTGQQFTEDETTDRIRVRRSMARLPQRPVTEVDTVKDVDSNDVTFTWDGQETLYLDPYWGVAFEFTFVPRRVPLQLVDVTYTHGYASVPDDIIAVVCSMVGRAFGVSPEMAGTTALSLGDASISYGAAGAAGGIGMLMDERAVLDRYRRIGATALLG